MKKIYFYILLSILASMLYSQNAYLLNEDFSENPWSLPTGWTGTMIVGEDELIEGNSILGAIFNQMWLGGGDRWATTPVVGPIFPVTVLKFDYRVRTGYGDMAVPFTLDRNNYFHILVDQTIVENVLSPPDQFWATKIISLDDFIDQMIPITFFVQSDNLLLPPFQVEIEYVEIYYTQVEFDLKADAIYGFDMPTVGVQTIYEVAVTNMGTAIFPVFTLELYRYNESNDDELLTSILCDEYIDNGFPSGSTEFIPIEWIPDYEGITQIYAVVVYDEDTVPNNVTPLFTIDIHPEGTMVSYIGDRDSNLWNDSMINSYAKSAVTQTIYVTENNDILGQITKLGFVFKSMGDIAGIPLSIYLATTLDDSYDEEAPQWIPYSDFTMVFEGDFAPTETGEYYTFFDLIEPFEYSSEDGNLVLMVKKHFYEGVYSWENQFKASQIGSWEEGNLLLSGIRVFDSDNDIDLENLPTGADIFTVYSFDNLILKISTGDVSEDDLVMIPSVNKLLPNYPNPFNPTTTISFVNAREGNVQINVFNIKGQKVKNIVNEHFNAGSHSVSWDGKGTNGIEVSSGIYFYQMNMDGFTTTKRMVLIK